MSKLRAIQLWITVALIVSLVTTAVLLVVVVMAGDLIIVALCFALAHVVNWVLLWAVYVIAHKRPAAQPVKRSWPREY